MDSLPTPLLALREEAGLLLLTDDALARACGVRVAFSSRLGGVSEGCFSSLNLGGHVGDDPECVRENRTKLARALGADGMPLIVLNQVHGTDIVSVLDAEEASLGRVRDEAVRGADGVTVAVSGVAALLCFADCAPLAVVSPTGRFAVAHAGWRGAYARIASKAVSTLAQLDGEEAAPSDYNAYIGPCIRVECFECGEDVCRAFADRFGEACVPSARHVDLASALACDLASAGIEPFRICDAGICTVCRSDEWFSYRASKGSCGRHGAIAFSEREVVSHGN